jgi:malate dehydrogenase (oxaloacetate-decarboxylating)(NADP+)
MQQHSDPPRGSALLQDPRRNKGTGFTDAERDALGLRGLLPPRVFSMEGQIHRVLRNLHAQHDDLEKYIFLVGLQDRNETLFYRLVIDHLTELMPIIYTPTVGEACRTFGHIYRRPRGLYITVQDRGRVRDVVANWPDDDIAVIVATDGERILGLGDLGAYGMGIPIGKLALYTACAGVHPARCLPVTIDAGIDNPAIRDDPLYTGIPQPRIRGAEYDALIEEFVTAVEERWPHVLLQWEDFATANAFGLLARYRDRLCTFNDDIQGTAAVTLAALLGAARITGRKLTESTLLFFGAGASATGVADLIVAGMVRDGLAEADARRRVWLFDSKGLVTGGRDRLEPHKLPYAHAHAPVAGLADAIHALGADTLIGLSTRGGAFDESVLRAIGAEAGRPVVFALSNPTANAECTAEQAYRWTEGRAVFASGSPFDPVELDGRRFVPRQCNNAYVFPGVGLGVVVSHAGRVSDAMFLAAADRLAAAVTDEDRANGSVLPALDRIRHLSSAVAADVATIAVAEGTARVPLADPAAAVERERYDPVYANYA